MKINLFYLIISISFNIFESVQCTECSFFNQIKVIATLASYPTYFPHLIVNNFTGCLEEKQFNRVIIRLDVVQQNIVEIGDHAVHDLPKLRSLSFRECGIKNISFKAFDELPKLKYMDFSRNELHEINSGWFFNTPNISSLDARYNKIEQINEYTFRFATNMKELKLDYNQISYVGEKALSNWRNMELLSLRHNRITQLDANILCSKIRIQALYLNANFLNFLSGDLLQKLSVKFMGLDGNPWKCPCLTKIQVWMDQSNVTLSGFCKGHQIPTCIYDSGGHNCSETVNGTITRIFLNTVKNLDLLPYHECANLSNKEF